MAKSQRINQISVSAPGRICLFGEHQDYFGLPVIPAAIDLRITITGQRRSDKMLNIQLPDINSQDEFSIEAEVPYILERDYLRSGFNILFREGLRLDSGYDCKVHGTIPIKAGCSSSSALCIAWIRFLLALGDDARQSDPTQIARLAHQSEVKEFNEPGGMMDHLASALGSVIHVDFEPEFRITKLDNKLGTFVLGNSFQEKDTLRTLTRIKTGVYSAVEKIRQNKKGFAFLSTPLEEVTPLFSLLELNERELLEGILTIHKIAKQAKVLFVFGEMDDYKMGELLNAHHRVLREKLHISTDKIERMLEAVLKAGALGGKINGSGEGGCMFAYAPTKAEEVAEAITKCGGGPYIINLKDGVRKEYSRP